MKFPLALLVLGGILLLAPSGGYHAFNGLPLNTGPEFGLFLLILPFLVWTSQRERPPGFAGAAPRV